MGLSFWLLLDRMHSIFIIFYICIDFLEKLFNKDYDNTIIISEIRKHVNTILFVIVVHIIVSNLFLNF